MRFNMCAALAVAVVTSVSQVRAHDGEPCDGIAAEELSPSLRHAVGSRRVAWHAPGRTRGTAHVQLLAINDFHGRLGTGLKVGERPVGGAAVLAAYLRDEQASFDGTTFVTHAGDHVGASPPNSALLQDEPAISVLNALANPWCRAFRGLLPQCNVIGTLGNHEFDEGVAELLRLIYGGQHEDGPFLDDPYRGATFPYVSANVVDARTGLPLLLPFVVREAEGESVAFVGATLRGTPSIVSADGVKGVRFLDEADAINAQVRFLKKLGVQSIVVLIHQGGRQTAYEGATQNVAGPAGEIAAIVARLDGAVDVVVSGHAHAFTNALLPNAAGNPVLVTQAFSSGTAYADIELEIDRRTHDVVAKSAVIETTYGDAGPGLSPAADVAKLVARADTLVAPRVNREVGVAAQAIDRVQDANGESAMGDLIADAQRAAVQADVALMNPGGLRADLDAGPITWGELFTVQPFGNDVVRLELTGAQLRAVLEQQWSNPAQPRLLQVSGLRVTWSDARAVGSRIVAVEVAGQSLVDTQVYRVAANSFLAGGGDGFTAFAAGANRAVGPTDLDALVSYVEALGGPLAVQRSGRLVRIEGP